MDDDFTTQLDLPRAIATLIDTLTFEFGPAAASRVAERRKQALAELVQDPRYQSIAREVYKDQIALRGQRRDAQKATSNGIAENIAEIHSLAFNAEQADALARLMAPGEYYLPGQSTPRGLRTSLRIYPRSELTMACRTSAQLNDEMFARGFPNEAEVRAAEERLAEAKRPPISPGGKGMVNSSDWRHR